ncbi:SUKH-4 family immunity protein [Streptomyces sp. NBC_01619]|uniref:SUKH-4 family immunity protein n=1 Tax=Streptomyces pratisoli TaxID=3139917 RepID=A0ACC6QQZ5_9ACTN|nr:MULTISPECIES: SUKH-4 family immunity protein [unclassified Streptomyces]MCX4514514.1 SUKH-4 family immunity protein [Streptomyces sp. NBC_01619]
MNYSVSTADIVRLFGLPGVVMFPRDAHDHQTVESPSMRMLHEVGLPHDDLFLSRMDVKDPVHDPALLGEFLASIGRPCPPGAEEWAVLGYFQDSLLALDSTTEKVYAFPEGTSRHLLMHRNVESLVYSLCALQEFHLERDASEDEEALALQTRSRIEAFDSTPFEDPISEWNIIFDEIMEGSW